MSSGGTVKTKLLYILKLFRDINFVTILRSIKYLKYNGIKSFFVKFREKIDLNISYETWIKMNEPSDEELAAQRATVFRYTPTISIVVPVFNTPKKILIEMIESVINQTYGEWELCIADGASDFSHVRDVLAWYEEKDKRIKVEYLSGNQGISGNSNAAISLSSGDFITFLDHDDVLPLFTLYEIVRKINEEREADLLYSDEDKISYNGTRRFDPHFKPDWSPDTFNSYNYITHLCVMARGLLNSTGFFRQDFDGSQDYDLILRATAMAKKIVHIPKILYHWRISRKSTANDPSAKIYTHESGKKALQDNHAKKVGVLVKDGMFINTYKIEYQIQPKTKVSIVISNKDHINDLKKCLDSIYEKTTYKNYEIILVENESTDKTLFEYYEKLKLEENIKIIVWDKPFNFSAVNNYAINYVSGDVLLFLNNDVEIINSDWIENMLQHALRTEVGAVGAKLYYPDDTVQHAGVILGIGGVAGHSHKYFPRASEGYMKRLGIIQNLTAVTAACMMMRKDVFREVGGFDESFTLAFNDVDICMKIREKGYLIIFTPYAELYHYESKTRGLENTAEKVARFGSEIDQFKIKWGKALESGDPYYSPNLSLTKENFSLRR